MLENDNDKNRQKERRNKREERRKIRRKREKEGEDKEKERKERYEKIQREEIQIDETKGENAIDWKRYRRHVEIYNTKRRVDTKTEEEIKERDGDTES
jgi:hypothetical protein